MTTDSNINSAPDSEHLESYTDAQLLHLIRFYELEPKNPQAVELAKQAREVLKRKFPASANLCS